MTIAEKLGRKRMNLVTVGLGIIAVFYSAYTFYARAANQEKFGKLTAMQEKFGKKSRVRYSSNYLFHRAFCLWRNYDFRREKGLFTILREALTNHGNLSSQPCCYKHCPQMASQQAQSRGGAGRNSGALTPLVQSAEWSRHCNLGGLFVKRWAVRW